MLGSLGYVLHCKMNRKKPENSLEVNIEQFVTLLSQLHKQEEVMLSCARKGCLEGSEGLAPHIPNLSLRPLPL